MVKSGVVAGTVLALLVSGVTPVLACTPIHAYVDCAAPTDGKGTKASPYNSLADANRLMLSSGDSVRFRRGTTCRGTLRPTGSGDPSEPVTIGAYGPGGALPALAANGAPQALMLANQQDVRVSDLDLSGARAGADVTADDYGPMGGIVLRRLDIHDVTDGIVLTAGGTTSPSSIDDARITANRIHSVSGNAVSAWSNWCRRPDVAPDWRPASCRGAWDPMRDLRVERNLLSGVGGDGIALATTQDARVARNWLEGSGGTAMSVSGSSGATISGNEASGARTAAYGVGPASDRTTLTGDFSHDDPGGFLRLDSAGNAPISGLSVAGNLSVDDHGHGIEAAGGPVRSGRVEGNTLYVGDGVAQEIADSTTSAPLDVRFAGNLVMAAPGAGTVGWNLPNPGWRDANNLLRRIPVPSGATGTIVADPELAAPGGDDPFGYRLLAGSPALGTGVSAAAFPLSLAPVPANAPNAGAVQAAAGPPMALADTFDPDPEGAAPAGWTVSGATVEADPAGFTGHSLTLPGAAHAERSFQATGGDVRIDLRVWTPGPGRSLSVRALDTAGRPVATVGFGPGGRLTYSDGAAERTGGFAYPAAAWTRLSILLRPATRTYTVTADGLPVGSGHTVAGSGIPGRIDVTVPAGRGHPAGSFAVDDVLVSPACCPCGS